METTEKLNWLKLYFDTRRGLGHTYTMINGVKNNVDKCAVLVRNQSEAKYMFDMAGKGFRTFSWDGDFDRIRGLRFALVIDNNAMISILEDALDEIRKLRADNTALKAGLLNYAVPSKYGNGRW